MSNLIAKNHFKAPNSHKESNLEEMVAKYLQTKHKKIMFHFDLGAGNKKTKFQAVRAKKLHGKWSRGYCDLFIIQPNKYYSGLFIEIKTIEGNPFKKDGTLKKSEHLETQAKFHDELKERGYHATFGVGFKAICEIIDEYLENV